MATQTWLSLVEHGVAYVLCAGSPLRGQTGALRNARPNTVTWWLSEANAASITIEVVFFWLNPILVIAPVTMRGARAVRGADTLSPYSTILIPGGSECSFLTCCAAMVYYSRAFTTILFAYNLSKWSCQPHCLIFCLDPVQRRVLVCLTVRTEQRPAPALLAAPFYRSLVYGT